ncbi:hypothetical protein [Sinomonas albida]
MPGVATVRAAAESRGHDAVAQRDADRNGDADAVGRPAVGRPINGAD